MYLEYSLEKLIGKTEGLQVAKLLKIAEWEMEKIQKWNRDQISVLFQKISQLEDIKLKHLGAPFFVIMLKQCIPTTVRQS